MNGILQTLLHNTAPVHTLDLPEDFDNEEVTNHTSLGPANRFERHQEAVERAHSVLITGYQSQKEKER
jgi:hypothetical protein